MLMEAKLGQGNFYWSVQGEYGNIEINVSEPNSFNFVNAGLNGYFLSNLAHYDLSSFQNWNFYLGILLFISGFLINLAMLYYFVDVIGFPHEIVQALAILLVSGYLFLTTRFFVFPRHAKRT